MGRDPSPTEVNGQPESTQSNDRGHQNRTDNSNGPLNPYGISALLGATNARFSCLVILVLDVLSRARFDDF